MQRFQAFQYELMPTGDQQRDMVRFAGACRFVFNKALALQKENHAAGNKFIGYVEMANLLPAWKSEFQWLRESPSQALQHALKNLDRAFINFFEKRADYPRFKKRGYGHSFRFPQGFQLDRLNSRVFLPKLGWVRYWNSREVLGTVKNITVSRRNGKWLVSIQTERVVDERVSTASSAIGIDVGIVRFATISDGTPIEPLHRFKKHQYRLRRYQRRMSRKKKFSNNWNKAKARVQKIHAEIANARKDFLHKTTTTISKNHAMVVMEDLEVRNLSRSSRGTSDQPGKNVRQKAGLNRSILDQGWSEFRRQLEYKMLWKGGVLLAVPAQNTSRTCPHCGHVAKENRKTQAKFECVECGHNNNADVVGAINILERGHRLLACGGDLEARGPRKQEPTEMVA
jgi:putative transposase